MKVENDMISPPDQPNPTRRGGLWFTPLVYEYASTVAKEWLTGAGLASWAAIKIGQNKSVRCR
ncbi:MULTISPECIES: hypothetical protein [Streptomyces]|uniref:Uncharacterized protein n=2 Tax=Streptomyces TaxID=1883 RepID=A0ABV9IKW5_9ACTN